MLRLSLNRATGIQEDSKNNYRSLEGEQRMICDPVVGKDIDRRFDLDLETRHLTRLLIEIQE